MFRTTQANVGQKRTIRPLYAMTQATPYAGFLDPAFPKTTDIYPGMVMTKLAGEVFTLASASGHKGFGLAALFCAPTLGIDEITHTGTNNFTVWTGGPDATFEVLAPAFDTTADYTQPNDGTRILLSHTLTAHSKGAGKLTKSGSANASSNPVAELVAQPSANKLIVRLNVVA